MVSVAVLLAVSVIAGSMNDARPPEAGPYQSGVHVNRHVDAHAPRDGEPAASAPQEPARSRSAPDPSQGGAFRPPPVQPPALQPYRDRRY